MMLKGKRIIFITVLTIIFCFVASKSTASAAGIEEGSYTANIDLAGLSMGASAFSKTTIVEREGNHYYFTFGHSSSVSNLKLNLEDKQVGYLTQSQEDWTYYTYSVSWENLIKSLSFSCMVNAMKMEVSFKVSIDLNSLTKTSDGIRDLGERPAEFVPVFSTDASGEYEMSVNTTFIIPELSAGIGDRLCDVVRSISYNGTEIQNETNKIVLDKIGTYFITYKASSSLYQTSLGNDTYADYEIKLIVRAEGGSIARYEDIHCVLSAETSFIASRITDSSNLFSLVSTQMAEISDHYEAFTVSFINDEGSTIALTESVRLYFNSDSYYDRTKIKVYHMDDEGKLTKVPCKGYGRYVLVETDLLGTFIVCLPGVAFHMPMWGYLLICIFALILLIALIVSIILIVKRRRRRNLEVTG